MNKTEKKLIPELRFPEFENESEWEYLNGDKLFEPISNKNHNSDLPILAITQEQGAIPRELIDYNIAVSEKSIKSYKVVEVGDFIISLRSFQGGIEYSNYLGLCSPAYIVLRKKQNISNDFYRHYFKSFPFIQDLNKNLEGIRDGKMVSYKQFSDILIPKPIKPEQQKIASCLSSFDELIAAHNDKLKALKDHKKGLMQNLFPKEGEKVPKYRFQEFEKDREWEFKTLDDICKLVRGPFGGALKKEIFVKEGYAVYEQSHAIYSDFNSFRYRINGNKFSELKRFAVKAGDLIMSCSGTMGKFAVIPDDFEQGVINQALLKLTVKTGYNNSFVKISLETDLNQKKLLSQSAGGAIKNVVSVSQIRELELAIPKQKEQQKVASSLSALDELIMAQTDKIEQLQQHKKGLMQRLFPKTVST